MWEEGEGSSLMAVIRVRAVVVVVIGLPPADVDGDGCDEWEEVAIALPADDDEVDGDSLPQTFFCQT